MRATHKSRSDKLNIRIEETHRYRHIKPVPFPSPLTTVRLSHGFWTRAHALNQAYRYADKRGYLTSRTAPGSMAIAGFCAMRWFLTSRLRVKTNQQRRCSR